MSRYLFDYSREYDPSAPLIELIIQAEGGRSETVTAFVDSGADGTIIPLRLLQKLGARYSDQRLLIGTTGKSQVVGLFPVTLQIGQEMIYGVAAAGYGEEIILGRDVLNQIVVILDGPGLTVEVNLASLT